LTANLEFLVKFSDSVPHPPVKINFKLTIDVFPSQVDFAKK